MLIVQNVGKTLQTKSFRKEVLKNIQLEVSPREIVGILGRAGAGKTPLLRCIHCLENTNEGKILLDNTAINLLKEPSLRLSRRLQGMIFKTPSLLASLTVSENIALPLKIAGLSVHEQHKQIQSILQLTGLTESQHSYPKELSIAQQYRVSIARAVVHHPKIVLCDDFSLNCDTKTTHQLIKLLRDLNEKYHFSLIIASQDLEIIKSICHRAYVLHEGEVVEQGNIASLITHPKTQVLQELVKSANRLALPIALRKRLKSQWQHAMSPVLHLCLPNPSEKETYIAQAIKNYDLSMNILQTHLDFLRDSQIAIMIAEFKGTKENIQAAMQFLEDAQINIKVLGYVN